MKLVRSGDEGDLTYLPKIQPYFTIQPGPFHVSAKSYTHAQFIHRFPPLLPHSLTFSFNFQMGCCDRIAGGGMGPKGQTFFISPRCICVDTPFLSLSDRMLHLIAQPTV